jgi:hypothetical protein
MAGHDLGTRTFTLSYRDILPACKSLFIQISPAEHIAAHILRRVIIGQGEQLGIRLLKNPRFSPGSRRILPTDLDDRHPSQAATTFFADPADVSGGLLLEETMIPRFAYSYGGYPVESPPYGRILQGGSDYILIVKNEGFSPTDVTVNVAFREISDSSVPTDPE